MQAGTLTVGKLFKQDRRLVVPLFQRPYVWNQEAQWEPLWEDIRAVAERLLVGTEPKPHFVGAVVLDQAPKPTGFLESRLVIDGQQRLTTLQLILESFADCCEGLVERGSGELTNYTRALRKLTRNDDVFKEEPDGEYKVWPTNADQVTFRTVMLSDSPAHLIVMMKEAAKQRPVNGRLAEGYTFFYDSISEWLAAQGDELGASDALFRTLNDYIRVVVIDLESDDDAQLIFETLNARGTPLLPADLVKNDLLHRALAEHEDVEALYTQYWSTFDDNDAYWRAEIGTGHAKRARVDTFLQHYLAMRTRSEVATAHLYSDYRRFVKHSDKPTRYHLQDLCKYADIYRSFDAWEPQSREGEFFALLATMGITSAFPFLLALFAREDLIPEDRRRILGDLASFLVRRLVCHLSTRGYSSFFISLLDAVADSDDMPAAVNAYLASGSAEATRWPRDDEFEVSWMSYNVYGVIRQDRVRLILEALEDAMRGPKTEHLVFGKKLTIEHLMPQKWQDHYPMPTDKDPVEARLERENLIHTFGNLTLLTEALNPSVSNGAWHADGQAGKREQIVKHSVLALNLDLPNEWDEHAIIERGRRLFSFAKTVWNEPPLIASIGDEA
jgi:hypothetical protein